MADALNVNFQRYDDIRKLHRIFESNGGGVALFDFDGDGWLDIFFTNGCRLPLKTKTEAKKMAAGQTERGAKMVTDAQPKTLSEEDIIEGNIRARRSAMAKQKQQEMKSEDAA